jgi:hypothetical protein
MNTGVHAIGWGLSRLAIVVGITVFGAIFAYVILVFVIVAGQAAAALGQ